MYKAIALAGIAVFLIYSLYKPKKAQPKLKITPRDEFSGWEKEVDRIFGGTT